MKYILLVLLTACGADDHKPTEEVKTEVNVPVVEASPSPSAAPTAVTETTAQEEQVAESEKEEVKTASWKNVGIVVRTEVEKRCKTVTLVQIREIKGLTGDFWVDRGHGLYGRYNVEKKDFPSREIDYSVYFQRDARNLISENGGVLGDSVFESRKRDAGRFEAQLLCKE